MKKNTLFSEVYALDKSTNRYMIEIALDHTKIFLTNGIRPPLSGEKLMLTWSFI
jgi:hypothetical protein